MAVWEPECVLERYKLFFSALASRTAPVIGEVFKLCPDGDVVLRIALCRIVDIPAGAFITPVAQTYGTLLVIFCHFDFLLMPC